MQKLTERQCVVLDYIRACVDANGYPPTLREIGRHMGISSTNGVNDHLRALEKKGYLTRQDMKSRTLRPTPPPGPMREKWAPGGFEDDGMVEVPIMGRVAAGMPLEAIEAREGTVRIDKMMLGGARDVFGLRISGDSMVDAGILDGDYVFVRKQIEADRGDIVVALVGDEATCKHYYPERDHVRLQPANTNMAAILVPRNDWRTTQILGVVVGIYRRLV